MPTVAERFFPGRRDDDVALNSCGEPCDVSVFDNAVSVITACRQGDVLLALQTIVPTMTYSELHIKNPTITN